MVISHKVKILVQLLRLSERSLEANFFGENQRGTTILRREHMFL
jgi:hypothetical protein